MCTIVTEPNKALRTVAIPVATEAITSDEIKGVIACMQKALHREPDGVAIAAPQIGKTLRIFIIAGFVFDLKRKNVGGVKSPDRIFINPEITKRSKETKWVPGEGCLSVRWVYGTVQRSKQATVRAYDQNGKKFTLSGSGLLAQIFQHECDHLDGVLFIDHAKDIRPMTEEEIADYKKELKEIAERDGRAS